MDYKELTERADSILELLAIDHDISEPETALRDLLADARHFADAHSIDYAEQDRIAFDNYASERHDAAAKPVQS